MNKQKEYTRQELTTSFGQPRWLDAFIESKADELVRLQKIVAFWDYRSRHQKATTSREEIAILGAVDDLLGGLRRSLSAAALRRTVDVSE